MAVKDNTVLHLIACFLGYFCVSVAGSFESRTASSRTKNVCTLNTSCIGADSWPSEGDVCVDESDGPPGMQMFKNLGK